ncbi:MAG TPA: Gfo/Idh/MocA family oxidoreductase [Solirubrobacteraceae bacterium]|jgi:predicted dehydrogenase
MSATATRTLRWGILSPARIVEELMPAFRDAEVAEVAAVASRELSRAESFAAAHAIPTAYGSYEELLGDPGIDCVYIPLPNALHAEWTRAALESGKHVLCEKPMTPSTKEARALFALARERGLQLMEAFMYRHHPKTKQLRDILRSGELGELRVLRMWFHFQVDDPASDIRYVPELAGGALRDVGCYCVSLANFIFGEEPDSVSAIARYSDSGVDEVFAGNLRYGSGGLAHFDCGMASTLSTGVEALCSRGTARVATPWYAHLEPTSIELETPDGRRIVPTPGHGVYQLEIENICAAVLGEGVPEISAEETLQNLTTIERLLAAAIPDQR